MLGKEDLQVLAADIKQNGLLHPIVLDPQGRLLDGRNRLAACKLAKVPPTYVTIDPPDVVTFIISENANRRHMGPGARAMAITRAVRDQEKNGDEHRLTQPQLRAMVGVGDSVMKQASIVYQYALDKVGEVIAGGSLKEAYEDAVKRKARQEEEQKAMQRLKKHHPDLFDRIEACTLDLPSALEIAELLEEQARVNRRIVALKTETANLIAEQIEPFLTLDADEAFALAERVRYVPAVAPTPEQQVESIIESIDPGELLRAQRILASIKVRDRIARSITGIEPTELVAELPLDQVAEIQRSLVTFIRWFASAYVHAESLLRHGKLEALP